MTTLRRHRRIAALLVFAGGLRILTMVAFPPAFWYFGDSGSYVTLSQQALMPHNSRALGYVVVLKIFGVTGTFVPLIGVQHLAGLLSAVGGYALLIRRGLPRWLACLAVVPVLFDARQVVIEHYLLTETLFTALLAAGVGLLLWWPRPGPVTCVAAGLLVVLAWFTRPNALPIAVLLGGYLLIRRAGVRRVMAFAAAFLLPFAAVLIWIGDRPSGYGASWTARMLYGRTAGIADCARLQLSPAERALCPTEPLGQRPDRADWYVWNGPAVTVPHGDNVVLLDFAREVIVQQPGDYLRLVSREMAALLLPWQQLDPGSRCLDGWWVVPETARDSAPIEAHCHPALARAGFQAPYADPASAPPATALTTALHAYSRYANTPPAAVGLALLLGIAALALCRRNAGDVLLLALISASLLALPVLMVMYDARYVLPALPFLGVMAALAGHQVWARGRTAGSDDPGTPDKDGAEPGPITPDPAATQ